MKGEDWPYLEQKAFLPWRRPYGSWSASAGFRLPSKVIREDQRAFLEGRS
jgi:hypothetical protein